MIVEDHFGGIPQYAIPFYGLPFSGLPLVSGYDPDLTREIIIWAAEGWFASLLAPEVPPEIYEECTVVILHTN